MIETLRPSNNNSHTVYCISLLLGQYTIQRRNIVTGYFQWGKYQPEYCHFQLIFIESMRSHCTRESQWRVIRLTENTTINTVHCIYTRAWLNTEKHNGFTLLSHTTFYHLAFSHVSEYFLWDWPQLVTDSSRLPTEYRWTVIPFHANTNARTGRITADITI